MVALRAVGYKHGRTEFYAAEPRRIMEVTMADIKQITPETSIPSLAATFPYWLIFGRLVRALSIALARRGRGSRRAGRKLAVAKCNVDDNQDLAMKFGVMSIPTLVVFKNGEEVDRSVGALPKARLQALLEKHL